MDRHLFNKWFEEDFVPQVKKYLIKRGLLPKAILFLYNAPAHPDATTLTSSDKLIKAIFLPANTTAPIQPMDQGVLEDMKRRYKKSLLRSLLMADNDGKSMIEFVKKINIKDVIYLVADAWDDIPSLTITKSWNKVLHSSHLSESEVEISGDSTNSGIGH